MPSCLKKMPFMAVVLLLASFNALSAALPGLQIVSEHASFDDLIDKHAHPELITDSAVWAEGPACTLQGLFIFSDVKQNRVMSWSAQQGLNIWLSPSDYQNGHAIDAEGRIIAASHGKRAILRQELNGTWSTLASTWQGKRLNSPNDVTIAPDGAVWFTDPTFGVLSKQESYGGKPEQGGEYVYRYDPTLRKLSRLDTPEIHSPNGLAFAPDGKTLYLSDTQQAHDFSNRTLAHRIMAYHVNGKHLSAGRVFAEVSPGIPDGITTDEKGNVWSSSKTGIQVFSSQGVLIGKIRVPSSDTSNLVLCTDAGHKNWLYVTAANRVLRLPVNVSAAVSLPDDKAK